MLHTSFNNIIISLTYIYKLLNVQTMFVHLYSIYDFFYYRSSHVRKIYVAIIIC